LKIDNHGDKYDVIKWLEFIESLKEKLLDVKTKIPSDNKELLIDAQQDVKNALKMLPYPIASMCTSFSKAVPVSA
jgi:hypothetical protein